MVLPCDPCSPTASASKLHRTFWAHFWPTGRSAAQALDAANPDPGQLAEIEAEQHKLRSLRHDLDPADLARAIALIHHEPA
jgi:DNA-binding MurR/RpiR family transcriptional regulator